MILHLSQIFLTDARTFICKSFHLIFRNSRLQRRKYKWTVVSNRYRMFKVSGQPAISRYRSPAIIKDLHIRAQLINHRFDGQHDSWLQPHSSTGLTEVWHLRTFMKSASDSVPDKIAHYRKSMHLNMTLYRVRHIRKTMRDRHAIYCAIQRLFRNRHQSLRYCGHPAYRQRHGSIAIKFFVNDTKIDAQDITCDKRTISRHPMYDLFIH